MSSSEKINVRIRASQATGKSGASMTHFNAPSGHFMDIISKSLAAKASSIHIEPTESRVVVRFRKDGVMREVQAYEKKVHLPLVLHIKTVARVQPIDQSAECGGPYIFEHENASHRLSISTLPTRYGEKVVISIEDVRQSRILSSLGIWGSTLSEIKKCLSAQKGLLVVAGQEKRYLAQTIQSMRTLLGEHDIKSTSLSRPTLKSPQLAQISEGVLIVEDVGSSKVLRTLLEDNASKQLVIVGLPVSSVEGVYTFLTSSGAESHLIEHSVNAVLLQRGVRVLCANCRVAHTPDDDELRVMYKMCGVQKATFNKVIHELELSAREEFADIASQNTSTSFSEVGQIYTAQKGGCDSCFGTGFDGTILLCELQKNTAKSGAGKQISMAMDGVVKVLCGITSLEEVERAVA